MACDVAGLVVSVFALEPLDEFFEGFFVEFVAACVDV